MPVRGSVLCTRCPKPASRLPVGAGLGHDGARPIIVQRYTCGLRTSHAGGNHFHAAGSGAAMIIADGENARGDGGGYGLTVA